MRETLQRETIGRTDGDRLSLRSEPKTGDGLGRRYLLYSHDGVGLGHTCRNVAIARAITSEDESATVLLATGSDDAVRLGIPDRVEVLKLPSLRKVANETYASRRLLVSPDDIHRIRARLLAGVVGAFRPDVVLVDKHPLGAGGELREALSLNRELGGSAVLGLRDILDEPETVRAEWERHDLGSRIASIYDRVLIYGQRGVFDPVTAYGLTGEVVLRSVFCGYVARGAREAREVGGMRLESGSGESGGLVGGSLPVVMATVGGGEDGATLVSVFLEASCGAPWRAIAVSGPLAAEGTHERLEGLSRRAGAVLHRFLPDMCRRMEGVDALVCMGGYNTLAEAVGLGLPVVCVPRVHPRREQLMRAKAFERLGLLECLPPSALTVASLRESILRALGRKRADVARRCAMEIRLDGASRAAAVLRSVTPGREERRGVGAEASRRGVGIERRAKRAA
ncbi:MAG: glycosyltransferase family protein [Limisphaerales bacterium]